MDAIDTKLNQLSTSFQQFYMSIINGEVIKGIVNIGQTFIDMFNNIGPIFSISVITALINSIRVLTTNIVAMALEVSKRVKAIWSQTESEKTEITRRASEQRANIEVGTEETVRNRRMDKYSKTSTSLKETGIETAANALVLIGQILPSIISGMAGFEKKGQGIANAIGSVATILGGIMLFKISPITAIFSIISGVTQLISSLTNLEYTLDELKQREEEAQATAAGSKKSYKDLVKLMDDYRKAAADYGDSSQEAQDAINALAEAFPELNATFDAEGNVVNNLTEAYNELIAVKRQEAVESQARYLNAEIETINKQREGAQENFIFGSTSPYSNIRNFTLGRLADSGYENTGVLYNLSETDRQRLIAQILGRYFAIPNADPEEIFRESFKAIGVEDFTSASFSPYLDSNWEEELNNIIDLFSFDFNIDEKQIEDYQKIFLSFDKKIRTDYQAAITNISYFYEGTDSSLEDVTSKYEELSIFTQAASDLAAQRVGEATDWAGVTYEQLKDANFWDENVRSAYTDLDSILSSDIGFEQGISLKESLEKIDDSTYGYLSNLEKYIDDKVEETEGASQQVYAQLAKSFDDNLQISNFKQLAESTTEILNKFGINDSELINGLTKSQLSTLNAIGAEQERLLDNANDEEKDSVRNQGENIINFWSNLFDKINSRFDPEDTEYAEAIALLNNIDATSNISELTDMLHKLSDLLGVDYSELIAAIDTDVIPFKSFIASFKYIPEDINNLITQVTTNIKNAESYLQKGLTGTLSLDDLVKLDELGFKSDVIDWSAGKIIDKEKFIAQLLQPITDEIENIKATTQYAEDAEAQDRVDRLEGIRNSYADSILDSLEEEAARGLIKSVSGSTASISKEAFNLASSLSEDLANYLKENFTYNIISGNYEYNGVTLDLEEFYTAIAKAFNIDTGVLATEVQQETEKTLKSNISSLISAISSDGTISITEDLFNEFFSEGDYSTLFTQTLDGYDFTAGPRAFLKIIDELIKSRFGEESEIFQNWMQSSQRADLVSQIDQNEILGQISQVGRSSADYQKIVESLRDATASAEDAQVAIDELGISAEQLYKTFDGKIGIKGTKELFKTYDSLAELEADRQEIVEKLNDTNAENTAEYDKQNRLLQVQLGLLNSQEQELLKRQVEFANDSGYGFTYGSPYDLAANAASFKSEIATGKIKTETVFDLFNNLGWDSDEAATLMDAFTKNLSPSDRAIKDINQRWSAVKKAYGEWDPDSGDIVLNLGEADGEIVSAITEGTDNILYAMLERRIELLNNQIETNKAILQIGQNETLFANAKIEGFTLTDNTGNPITSVSELWNRYIIENLDSDILTATFSELNIDPRTINAEQLMQAINYILSNYQGDLAGIGVVVTPEVIEPPTPESTEIPINGDTDPLMEAFKTAKDEIEKDSVSVTVSAKIQDALNKVNELIKTINNSHASLNVDINYNNNNSFDTSTSTFTTIPKLKNGSTFKGISQARGTFNAKGGRTLVGELGPELRVSNGQYSIVGGKGAEFVNLRKGDIIFNAQQTQELLSGTGNVRGQAFASGNLASSTEQLERELEELKSTLEALQKGSGSGAGDKGGSGGGGDTEEVKEYLMELEKWFNWLRRIEKLEYRISIIQAERENMADGSDFAQSIYEENALLQKQADLYEGLRDEQLKYRDSLKTKYLEEYGRYFYFIGNALQINEEEILKDTKNNEELGEEIQKLIDDYKEVTQNIADNTTSYENNKKAIEDNIRTLRDKYIDMENEILDALENSYQKQIDLKQNELDRRIESDQKYLDALKKNLDKERQMREQANSQEERESLERKLALLERDTSGASDKEIASLRDQIRSMREEQYYNQREQSITDLEDSLEAQQQIVQSEIDVLTEANEIKLENMRLYWQEVADIIAQGSDNIMAFLQANSQEYVDASKIQQEDYTSSWKQTIDAALTYAEDMKKKFDELLYSMKEPEEHGEDTTPAPSTSESSGSSGGGGGGGGSSGGSSGGTTTKTETKPAAPATGTLRLIYKVKNRVLEDTKQTVNVSSINFASFLKSFDGYTFDHADPTYVQIQAGKTSTITYFYNKVEEKKTTTTTTTPSTTKKSTGGGGGTGLKSSVSYKAFAGGGLVNYTGPAWVDGTPARPEAFLNADDTKLLANFLECAKSMTMGYSNYRAASFSNNETINSGVTIDKVEVTIESGVVSNRNDAVNLGHGIADGLMDIARQSGTISVTRR